MKLKDVRDLFAYLKTLPPVAGKARDHDVAFPFNIRRLVGGWKFLFLDGKPFMPDPRNRRPGTAVPIWSMRRGIAPNAIAHAIFSGASSLASVLPVVRRPMAKAG